MRGGWRLNNRAYWWTFHRTRIRALCLWGIVGLSVFVLGYDHCNGLVRSVGLRVSRSSAEAVARSFVRAACPAVRDGKHHVALQTNEKVVEVLLRVERDSVDPALQKKLRSLACFWRVESPARSGTVVWSVDVGPDGQVCGFRISPAVLKELGGEDPQPTENERATEYLHMALERAILNGVLVAEQFGTTNAPRSGLPLADATRVARCVRWGARIDDQGSLHAALELVPLPAAEVKAHVERRAKAIALRPVTLWFRHGIWLALAFAIVATLARRSGWKSATLGVAAVTAVMFVEQKFIGPDGGMWSIPDLHNLLRLAWHYSKFYVRYCVLAVGGGFMASLAFARPKMLGSLDRRRTGGCSSVAAGCCLGMVTLGVATVMEWTRLRIGGNMAAGAWFYRMVLNSYIPWVWPAITSVGSPFVEELQYRVLLLSLVVLLSKILGLQRRVGCLLAIVVSSGLFASAHAKLTIFPFEWSMLRVFVPGLLFGWAFVKWDFVAAFTAHWTFNAVLGCALLLRTPATVLEGVGATLVCGTILTASHAIVGRWQDPTREAQRRDGGTDPADDK